MLYSSEDETLLDDKICDIEKQADKIRRIKVDPTEKENRTILSFVDKYIVENKRIIYGGIAHNEAIGLKNINECFYNDEDIPDYDFYSPDPMRDIKFIADALFKNGFEHIYCRDALHAETFSVTVKGVIYCDITYMPPNIYYKIPTIKIKNKKYIHPHVAMIDYFRMFTDPLHSTFRWQKAMKRFMLLWNHYAIPNYNISLPYSRDASRAIDKMRNLLINKMVKLNFIFVGDMVHNYYLKLINEPTFVNSHIVCISTNFKKDAQYLYGELKQLFGNKMSVVEYYPFFQYTGRSVMFTLDNNLIIRIYDNNNMCVPYINITYNKIENVKIGTFPLIIMYYLIDSIRSKLHDHDTYKNMYSRICRIIEIRNKYLKYHNKTIFDKTPFSEFTVDVLGTMMSIHYKKILSVKNGTKRLTYDPAIGYYKKTIDMKYSVTTGLRITNKSELFITQQTQNSNTNTNKDDNKTDNKTNNKIDNKVNENE
jgi:hypothetical protein